MVALGPHGSEEEKLADLTDVSKSLFKFFCCTCSSQGRDGRARHLLVELRALSEPWPRESEREGKKRVDQCITKSQCLLNKAYFVAVAWLLLGVVLKWVPCSSLAGVLQAPVSLHTPLRGGDGFHVTARH